MAGKNLLGIKQTVSQIFFQLIQLLKKHTCARKLASVLTYRNMSESIMNDFATDGQKDVRMNIFSSE